jgi:molecular chaperone DnaK (HSP70)
MASGDESARLAEQAIFLTVPASFDAVARELTVRAAAAAGLPKVTLLEEPQSAFYSWLATMGDGWRKELQVGDLVVVCDIGGGTTDFSLMAVSEEQGNLQIERVAVGDHILLGGDNMDLALAYRVSSRLAEKGSKLDAWQERGLTHACRGAKETILSGGKSAPVAVLGRGRSVIGGSIKETLTREDVEAALLDGFFPVVPGAARPEVRRRVGLRELGLPYAQDAAVTRHLAKFVGSYASRPTAVLFNGGVMKGEVLRARIAEVLAAWAGEGGAAAPKALAGTDLDLAVAHGAAYYGLVRRGRGVRIRGGTARSYYIGIEKAAPAVPGVAPPISALCVAPFGMEEGSEAELKGQELGLVVGEPAEFRFLSSTTRRTDAVGMLVEDVGPELEELTPIVAELTGTSGAVVPVRLRSHVTEVGTLELWCVARDGQRWKLEFNVREATG